MLVSDLDLLACPRCFGALVAALPRADISSLPLPPGYDASRMLWDGMLRCKRCAAQYPLIEGVACLAAFGAGWIIPLREMESRLSLTLRSLEPRPWETGREELLAHQAETVTSVMDHLFNEALLQIDFSRAPRILDVGAGTCRTTEAFIARGAHAVAIDVDLPQLRYLSFKGVDHLPPPTAIHAASGRPLHFKEPAPLSQYLTRVFGDIGRLPFPDACFDVVFCRSVLHHLDGHERTMREMARVLRPGGRMIFCAEPIRSNFEDEDACYDRCVEREEGMNERVWPLSRFLGPIWRLARRFQIHTWPQPPSALLRRRVPFLADFLARRIGQGARVRGWQLAAMPFVNAAVSIYAERTFTPHSEPALSPPTPEEQADLERYCALFRGAAGRLREETDDLPRKRLEVNAIRRRLLARFAPPPSRLEIGRVPVHQLDRGWFDPVTFDRRPARPMAREAWFTLAAPQPAALQITAAAPGHPARLRVWGNGVELGLHDLPAGEITPLRIALPPLDPIVTFQLAALPAAGAADDAAEPLVLILDAALS